MKHHARDTDEAKRAEASRQERLSRQQNPQRMAQHILTMHQARDTDEAKRAEASQQERIARQRKRRHARRDEAEHKVVVGSKIYFIDL